MKNVHIIDGRGFLKAVFKIKNKANGKAEVLRAIVKYAPNDGTIVRYGRSTFTPSDVYERWI